jgi:hypothetical protein
MQIRSYNAQSAPALPKGPQAPVPQDVKPYRESWQVGDKSFSSTQDLVALGNQVDGQTATFKFTTSKDSEPFTGSEKVRNAAGAALACAAGGAVAGVVVGAGLTFMVGLGDLLGAFMSMSSVHSSGSSLLLLAPTALGAAIGAGIGAKEGYDSSPKAAEHKVSGPLKFEYSPDGQGTLAFYPGADLNKRVDLNTYQAAPEAPLETPPSASPAWNRVQGAVAGALLPGAAMIPLLGLGAGAYAGSRVGESIDKRTALGSGLGLVAGAAFTAASFPAIGAALNHGNWAGLAALSAVGAAAGALTGDKVFAPQGPRPVNDSAWWKPYEAAQ